MLFFMIFLYALICFYRVFCYIPIFSIICQVFGFILFSFFLRFRLRFDFDNGFAPGPAVAPAVASRTLHVANMPPWPAAGSRWNKPGKENCPFGKLERSQSQDGRETLLAAHSAIAKFCGGGPLSMGRLMLHRRSGDPRTGDQKSETIFDAEAPVDTHKGIEGQW